jgi:hypothetical protein
VKTLNCASLLIISLLAYPALARDVLRPSTSDIAKSPLVKERAEHADQLFIKRNNVMMISQMVTYYLRCGYKGRRVSETQEAQLVDNFMLTQYFYVQEYAESSPLSIQDARNEAKRYIDNAVTISNQQMAKRSCESEARFDDGMSNLINSSIRNNFKATHPRTTLPPEVKPDQAQKVLANLKAMK